MSQIKITKTIDAPIQRVFKTISDIRIFSEAVPDIVDIEFLSESQTGVGTRFKETRIMYGKEATEILEVTEQIENERIRIVADSHGVEWDSLYTLSQENAETLLTLVMEMRPHTLIAKFMTFFMKGSMQKAIEKDMEAVKKFCED